jgi:hypothetical protein
MAFAAHPQDTRFKVAVARALPFEQKAQSIALLREAAAEGDAEANYEIYEHYKSWNAAISTGSRSSPAPKLTGRCAKQPNWGILSRHRCWPCCSTAARR